MANAQATNQPPQQQVSGPSPVEKPQLTQPANEPEEDDDLPF